MLLHQLGLPIDTCPSGTPERSGFTSAFLSHRVRSLASAASRPGAPRAVAFNVCSISKILISSPRLLHNIFGQVLKILPVKRTEKDIPFEESLNHGGPMTRRSNSSQFAKSILLRKCFVVAAVLVALLEGEDDMAQRMPQCVSNLKKETKTRCHFGLIL